VDSDHGKSGAACDHYWMKSEIDIVTSFLLQEDTNDPGDQKNWLSEYAHFLPYSIACSNQQN
jgi:hypothetical protein